MRYAVLLLSLLATPVVGEPLRVVSWNVESGGNDPAVIANQLASLGRFDAYCLQEVSPGNIGRYAAAIRDAYGKQYRYIASDLGRGDRLLIVFDSQRLDLVESREMFRHGERVLNDWRHRSPLALLMKDRSGGGELFLMTVHLARGDARLREEQAIGLREWAGTLQRPVIAIGDFNFDFDIPTARGNPAFAAFTAEGSPWRWVKPQALTDTNWSDGDGDGADNYPDSMLDFAFIATPGGMDSQASSEVVVQPGDFPDDERTSDHRPVTLSVDFARARQRPGR